MCPFRPHVENDQILIDSTLLAGFFPVPNGLDNIGLSVAERARLQKADVSGAEQMLLDDPIFTTSHGLW